MDNGAIFWPKVSKSLASLVNNKSSRKGITLFLNFKRIFEKEEILFPSPKVFWLLLLVFVGFFLLGERLLFSSFPVSSSFKHINLTNPSAEVFEFIPYFPKHPEPKVSPFSIMSIFKLEKKLSKIY